MFKHQLFAAALLAASLFWLHVRSEGTASPAPAAPENTVDDLGTRVKLQPIFASAEAKADAQYFAAVFASAAERIAADAQRTTPVLQTRAQIETFVERCGALATSGKTIGRYPQLPAVIRELFQTHFPREPGKLTPADRDKAIHCFRALAAGCTNTN